jgi:haloacetate dehalogenase
LDHPGAVSAFASLTVVPTIEMWAGVDKAFAMAAYHWFMLAQPFDLPERLLASDPDTFLNRELAKSAGGYHLDERAIDAYRVAFREPSVRHAMCEDHRAAAQEDADGDTADRTAGRPAGSPRHRSPAMKRIFARSRCQGRPLPAALRTGRRATFVPLC